jgi:hypothetical protein
VAELAKIIARGDWGAVAPKGARNQLGSVLGVSVHWEAAAPPQDHADCAKAVKQIQAFHMGPSRGWSDIAYNYLACNHGFLFEGRGKGIGSAANGTDFGNQHFYAVCWLGGPGHKPEDEALGAIADARAMLAPDGDVFPHAHFFATACPGPDLSAWVKLGAKDPGKPDAGTGHTWTAKRHDGKSVGPFDRFQQLMDELGGIAGEEQDMTIVLTKKVKSPA